MKGRSHRLPVSESHHDEWVDGSWTVDCICGVNYDDGEEMVDCDECGVWVHTRCSRYVKSEKSFACDKCKSKNSGGGGCGVTDDSEETEVAEFLVELPTKTLRMENPNSVSVALRSPFRLWTDIPMEERVHVQGVPGGEPGLFLGSGMPSVFGPELWKSTGYVPKKFNFRYTEFSCLGHDKIEEEKELDKAGGEEDVNQADNGAGVLFSLSKENDNTVFTPVVDSIGVESPVDGSGGHEVVSLKQKKDLIGENWDFSCPEVSMKKKTSSVPIMLHFGKCKKEELEKLKDQSGKKKMRYMEEDGDVDNGAADASKAGSKAVNIQFSQNVLRDEQTDGLGECATNLAQNEHGLGSTLRNDISSDEIPRGGNSEDHVPVRSENFSKTNSGVDSLTEPNGFLRQPVKEVVPRDTLESCGNVGGGCGNAETGSYDMDPVAVNVTVASPDAKENRHIQSPNLNEANSRPNKKLKGDVDVADHRHHHVVHLPLNDVKLETMTVTIQYPDSSVNIFSEEGKVIETPVISSEASNPARSPTSRTDKSDEPPGNPSQYKRQPIDDGSTGARKYSGLKYSSEVADELHKPNGTARSHSTASYQHNAESLKSTSTSGGNISKPSNNHTAATIQNPIHSRQNGLSGSTVAIMKDNASADMVEHVERCGRLKKLVKERSRHLLSIPEPAKLSHTSDSKKPPSDSKDSSIHSSSKVPLVPNVAFERVSGECTSLAQIRRASGVQNKAAASTEPGKVGKLSQLGSHPSFRGNMTSIMAPTSANVPATLSDEELALLLHQELNSSPRVPRVPRMRRAGSSPQSTGPSATSVLMKRASSGGVKDQSVSSRRRSKDFSGEGSHGSVEVDNEAKEMEKKSTLPDTRSRDPGYSADLLSRREADDGHAKSVQCMKKTKTGSSLSSAPDTNGHNLSSTRPSSRTASGERVLSPLTTHTLPGLIAEIMREGKRITYKELCNAVLPHWPHLRKHNGERYAYSSHFQAVLDCLRNRSEWARLVDRGPKTSTSRKGHKFGADSLGIESEDNKVNGVRNASESKSFESHQENFPKGKRKARKRRRLVLQGRGIVRRRRRADVSDEECESFSTSSDEDSMSNEEEIEGSGASVGGSEASASSDEV